MLYNPKRLYSFGPFVLNASDMLLLHLGKEVELRPRAFDLLLFLVTHRDTLVSRSDIKLEVWQAANLDDSNIDHKIAEIRHVLTECDPAGEYIQTSRGHGWRFLPQVTENVTAPDPKGDAPTGAIPPSRGASAGTLLKRWLKPGAVAGAAVALAVIAVVLGPLSVPAEPSVLRYRKLTSDGRPKLGPIVTDGRFVYFAEALANVTNGVPCPASVPISGGDVVSPRTQGEPPALIWDIARQTGELVYARVDPSKGWSPSIWKESRRGIEPIIDNELARISPDGRSFAYAAGDAIHSEMIIRDLGRSPNVRK
jgi:DNA-binding winged helix-turn-helix (wHTH) protein